MGTENGFVHFFKFEKESKRFDYLRSWTTLEIKFTRVCSIGVHEGDKNEVLVAIAAKSLNIVYLNVWKQIYNKEKQQELHSGEEDQEDTLEYTTVGGSFHQGAITSMDLSI